MIKLTKEKNAMNNLLVKNARGELLLFQSDNYSNFHRFSLDFPLTHSQFTVIARFEYASGLVFNPIMNIAVIDIDTAMNESKE